MRHIRPVAIKFALIQYPVRRAIFRARPTLPGRSRDTPLKRLRYRQTLPRPVYPTLAPASDQLGRTAPAAVNAIMAFPRSSRKAARPKALLL